MNAGEASLRRNLDELWGRLEGEQDQRGRLQTVDLPIRGEEEMLRLGVGPEGRRLLLPIKRGEEDSLREDRRGSSVALLRRPLEFEDERWLFADLVCLRPELNAVFTALCADILMREEAFGGAPLDHARRALSEWRALFAGTGRHLGLQQLAGLFGELSLLVDLLQINPDAARFWLGPDRHRHDFVWPGTAVEAKTTVTTDGEKVRVHGVDQLEEPPEGELFLVFLRLETVPVGGTSVPELVDRACALGSAATILGRLELTGYRADDADRYRAVTFSRTEELWYRVDDSMERLVPQSFLGGEIPTGVDEINYTLDLARASPIHQRSEIEAVLASVGGE